MKQSLTIVTGAAGHLGSTIAAKLNDLGKNVYALCLPNEKNTPQGKNIRIYHGDICNIKSLEKLFEDSKTFDITLIHCAGIVSIASKYDPKVYDVNVSGTKNILAMCKQYCVSKLIYISSVHALPELPPENTMTEIRNFSPDQVVGLYAQTKAEATQCVLDYVKDGYYACIIHPSGMLGPGDHGKGHITQMVIDYCKGRLSAGVVGGYDFVDVRDVADGVISCCEKGKNGECYILSGQYYQVKDILYLLHKITGKRRIKRFLPLWFLKAMAPFTELYYKILGQPPLFTTYSLYTLNANARFSHEKASKEFNYSTRPLKQTLTDTIRWLTDHHRLKSV